MRTCICFITFSLLIFSKIQAQHCPSNFVKPIDKLFFIVQGGNTSYRVNTFTTFNYEVIGETNNSFSFGVGLDYYLKKNFSLRMKSIISEREFTEDQYFLIHSLLANYFIGDTFKFKVHSGLVYSHDATFEQSSENDFGLNLAIGFQFEILGQKILFEFENITFFRNVAPMFNDQETYFAKSLSFNIGLVF